MTSQTNSPKNGSMNSPMRRFFERFSSEDSGMEMLEWAIVGALITTAAAVTIQTMVPWINLKLVLVETRLNLLG